MTIFESASLIIAILSICIATMVVWKDRRRNMYSNLHMCFQRLHEAQNKEQAYTIEDNIFFEDNPNDEKTEKYKQESQKLQRILDRELEFSCYLVATNQIDIKPFFHLFGAWLAARNDFWILPHNHYKAKNNPYTVKVIMMCRDKKYLPIKENKDKSNLNKITDKFLEN